MTQRTSRFVASFFAISSGVAFAQRTSGVVSAAQVQEAGLTQFWQSQLPVTGGEEIREGYLIDEALYVTTTRGRIFALKADVGLLRWAQKVTESAYRVYAPSHLATRKGDGPVMVPTSNEVYVLDRFTGDEKTRFVPPFGIIGPGVGYDNLVFLGGIGRMHALLLRARNEPPITRWEALSGGNVVAKPLLLPGNMLVFASNLGTVISCIASDKTLNWTWRASGAINADPFADDKAVYVASMDRSLYKLSLSTGAVIWRARFPSPLQDGPVVAAGLVFQYCQDHGLSAVDVATGREAWRIPRGRAFAAHHSAGDMIFTEDQQLLIVNHATGGIEATVAAPAVLKAVSNPIDESVYLLGTGGRVVCLRLDTEPYLRRQQIMSAKSELNLSPNSRKKPEPIPSLEPVKEPDPLGGDPLRSGREKKP